MDEQTIIEITMEIKINPERELVESEQRIKSAKVIKGTITERVSDILWENYSLEMENDEFVEVEE